MKSLNVRECAVKACQTVGYKGGDLLLAILNEAFGGDRPDFGDDEWLVGRAECRVVYEAIAPDIIASVSEERADEEGSDAMPSWEAGEPDAASSGHDDGGDE